MTLLIKGFLQLNPYRDYGKTECNSKENTYQFIPFFQSCRIRSAKSIERFENAKKKQDSRKEQLRSFDDILERSSKLIRKEKQRSQSSSEI